MPQDQRVEQAGKRRRDEAVRPRRRPLEGRRLQTGEDRKAGDRNLLTDPVAKTFKAAFPKAEILKVDADAENGVTVYDLEFKDGQTEKETDITADGTMLEFTVVVVAEDVPAAAMKAVREAAVGAKLGRIERVEISYETKDGKAVKLPKPVTHYAVEIVRDGKTSEIVVGPDGTVVERGDTNEK